MHPSYLETSIVHEASSLHEVEEIQAFRYRVYVKEMGLDLPGVDHYRKILADPLDASSVHLYARLGSKLAGAVRLSLNQVPEGLESPLKTSTLPWPFVYCSRLYVLKERRGTGVMNALVEASFRSFYRQHAAAAICHCYPRLLKLYERHGFRSYAAAFPITGLERLGRQTPLICLLAEQRTRWAA